MKDRGIRQPSLVSYKLPQNSSEKRIKKEDQFNYLFNLRNPSGILDRLPGENSNEALERRKNLYSLQALDKRQENLIRDYPSYERRRKNVYSSKGGKKRTKKLKQTKRRRNK